MTYLKELTSWVERLDNLLKLQKELQQECSYMNLTRKETIELRMFLNTLLETEKANAKL